MALLLLRAATRRGAPARALALLALLAAGAAPPAGAAGPPDGTWRNIAPPERLYRLAFVDPGDGRLTCLRNPWTGEWWKYDLAGGTGWAPARFEGGPPTFQVQAGEYVVDPLGQRLIAVGFDVRATPEGSVFDTLQVWQLPLLGSRRWERLAIPGAGPSSRYSPLLAIDAAGGRLFLTGGYRSQGVILIIDGRTPPPPAAAAAAGDPGAPPATVATSFGDVWQLDLAGGSGWSEVAVAGPPLPGAEGGWATYEPTGHRLVLVAARDTIPDTVERSDVRALAVDGDRRWVTLFDGDPFLIDAPFDRAIEDPVANRFLVLHGGSSYEPAESTRVTRLDLRGAGSRTVESFSGEPRPWIDLQDPACIDPATRRLMLVGTRGAMPTEPSYSSGGHVDVWSAPVDGPLRWSQGFSSLASGEIGSLVPTVFDPVRRRVLLVDQRSGLPAQATVSAFNDDAAPAWTTVPCVGPAPSARREWAVASFDPAHDRLIVHGGGYEGVEFGDLWELSFAFSPPRWRRIVTEGPAPRPRQWASAVYDPVRRRMVLFGGWAGEPLGDTWALDLSGPDPAWRELAVHGAPPPARWGHAAIYDARRDAMVVFAGAQGTPTDPTPLRDTWALSFADGDTWVPVPLAGAPPLARYAHGAAYDPIDDRMIVMGGRDRSGARFDHQALVFGAPSRWEAFLPQGAGPSGAIGLALHYDAGADRLLVTAPELRGNLLALAWDRDPTPRPEPTGSGFRILGVGPNPSRGDVGIAFEVPRRTGVRLRLFDVRGRVVRDLGDRSFAPGPHLLWWDGRGDGGERLRDGVYFARLEFEGRTLAGKIVLMD